MVGVVRIHRFGGPEELVYEDEAVAAPGTGEVRIRHKAVGLNYTDIYSRIGRPGMKTPLILGAEGAGDVVAVGPGVAEFRVGDRVAYTGGLGAYAEERLYAADRVVKLPDAMSYDTAA
ncbi:MAG: alcohol dehydrogenase catalytic domain-containing protein, partial [Rhizobiales bacterium]|nr:alcohol dehydrogenase catalytic domain-containing protein [Hyphomicrobiales bacterium]